MVHPTSSLKLGRLGRVLQRLCLADLLTLRESIPELSMGITAFNTRKIHYSEASFLQVIIGDGAAKIENQT